MSQRPVRSNAIGTTATVSASLIGAAWIRRIAHRTGVSDAEAYGSLPGDGEIAHPMFEYNRGLTVSAPPADVWPWIVQMGYGRAGWYAPEALDRWANRWVWRLENEFPYEASPWVVLPEHQHVSVGDVIADGPGYAAYFTVTAVEPERHLVLYSIRHPWRGKRLDPSDSEARRARENELRRGGVYLEFSWAFVLRPISDHRTRLLVRARNNVAPSWTRAFLEVPVGLADVYEGMGMLLGIRRRMRASRVAPTSGGFSGS